MSIRTRLESMILSLEEHPLLEVTEVVFGPSASEEELETARINVADSPPGEWVDELEMYVQLDEDEPFSEIWNPSIERFFREVGSFDLEWRALPDSGLGDDVYGCVHIPRIEQVFPDSFSENLLADECFSDGNEQLYERARQLHLLDRFVPEGAALLDLSGGAFSLCYFSTSELPEESVMPTGLLFNDWLERLLNSRGFGYWLTACTVPRRDSREARTFLEFAPQLFSDFDPTLYVPRTTQHSIFASKELE